MKVIDNVPVDLDQKEIVRALAVGRLKDRGTEIASFVGKSRTLVRPKAVYTIVSVTGIDEDLVHLDNGQILRSIILADALQCGQEIAPYVVTIGLKLEEEASKLSKDNLFGAWTLEKIGDIAVQKAAIYVRSRVEQELGSSISSFGPGTGTGKLFGIEQQEVLFRILDPLENIGVRLTPSYLMLPRKSISGVLAATSKEYVACEYCPRKCEYRRRPFGGEYHSMKCDHRSD